MRIMITGGGTGGHTSPAAAIVEALRKREPAAQFVWVGKRGGIEERVSAAHDVPFRAVPAAGWPRGKTWRKGWVALKMTLAAAKAAWLCLRFRPSAVVGVGGYVSLPLGAAAQLLGIPVILHEQNKRLGMANGLLAKRAARVLLSYPETVGRYPAGKAEVVGNPVRPAFAAPPSREEACARLGLDPALPVVFVFGGSQGAHSLNTAMADLLLLFAPNEAQFLWMTGPSEEKAGRAAAKKAEAAVHVFGFVDDMVSACAASDVIVSRAGASSTAELAVLGKPAILIPYPFATDNHQEQNARAFEAAGAAQVLLDADCSGERLAALIRALLADRGRLDAMARAAEALAHPGAADRIAAIVADAAR